MPITKSLKELEGKNECEDGKCNFILIFRQVLRGPNKRHQTAGSCCTSSTELPMGPRKGKQQELKKLYKIIGSSQQNTKHMECSSTGLLDKAVQKELDHRWACACEEVHESYMPQSPIVTDSHILYRAEDGENKNVLRPDYWLCSHLNHDDLKREIFTTYQKQGWILSTSALNPSHTQYGTMLDSYQKKYLQSDSIKREIYKCPPREWKGLTGLLWSVHKLFRGNLEAEILWPAFIEEWIPINRVWEGGRADSGLYKNKNGWNAIHNDSQDNKNFS